jgi:ribosome-associated heat shock protein Hsp15
MPRGRADPAAAAHTAPARQRLDKWLWFARFARTRAAAQALVEAGRVRIEGRRVTSPGHGLKLGDVLTIAAPHATALVRVEDLGERRGGSEAAHKLYSCVDSEASPATDGCGETRP